MISFEYILLIGSSLILLSIIIAKFSDNLGVPTLLLFLGIGMLAGSDGLGGIYFDDAGLAQSIGIIALVFILFAGGLDTKWIDVRPVVKEAGLLATIGVLITAFLIAFFAVYIFALPFMHALLLGAIVSSTDAAAVFAVLRAKNVSLKGNLKPILELESGSNDPMAVFLTIGALQFITQENATVTDIILLFLYQMGIGALFGVGFGKGMVLLLNHLKFSYEGIYPVLVIAYAGLIYASTALINGSGFLAVYIAGLIVGNSDFIQKKSLMRFFDGLSWLGQIAMFLTLGLLVFPTHIVPVIGSGLAVALILIFIARPIGVFISLSLSQFSRKEKIFISWVGLRGAIPIILATFPLIAGIQNAELIFNVVFFIVITSATIQGWSIPYVAKWLGVDEQKKKRLQYPIEFAPVANVDTQLVDLQVPFQSDIIGKSIIELGMPHDSLIVLINRDDNFIVPSGGTNIEAGDTLLVLVNNHNLPVVRSILSQQKALSSSTSV